MAIFGKRKPSAPPARSAPTERLFLGEDGVAAVSAAVGLPACLLDNATIGRHIVPTCAAVFSEGDLIIRHNVSPKPGLREWFDGDGITEGRYFAGLTELYRNPPRAVREPLDDLQRAVAALVARGIVFGEGPLPMSDLKPALPPLARVEGSQVVFGGHSGQGEYREQLDRPVRYLLAVEPGIRLMHVIDQQVELLSRPAFSYNYMCLASQPFAAQFLGNYLLLRARQVSGHDQMGEEMIDRGFVILGEGDLAASLARFVDLDRKIGETHGRVDLAFYTGSLLPYLTAEQARRILAHVHFLLRPGGALLIGFPIEPSYPGRLDMNELLAATVAAGFSPNDGSRVHVGTSNLANPGLPVYMFLRKT